MNRRTFLVTSVAVGTATVLGGCSDGDESGRTYTLRMQDRSSDADDVLDFDTAGISSGQQEIVDTAVADGAYTEANVTWSTMPAKESISMEFRSVLQLIARHVDRDPSITEPVRFDTPSRYGRDSYLTAVEVE